MAVLLRLVKIPFRIVLVKISVAPDGDFSPTMEGCRQLAVFPYRALALVKLGTKGTRLAIYGSYGYIPLLPHCLSCEALLMNSTACHVSVHNRINVVIFICNEVSPTNYLMQTTLGLLCTIITLALGATSAVERRSAFFDYLEKSGPSDPVLTPSNAGYNSSRNVNVKKRISYLPAAIVFSTSPKTYKNM
ncbi:hypothetical protein OPQ81_006646 [Rhizoctonia solani]|nr:hypothetical protein OPQ81_006646 [Rhizoctonia solani]